MRTLAVAQTLARYVLAFSVVFFAALRPSSAINPRWWEERGVLKIDPGSGFPAEAADFAVLNQGQLKNIAEKALAEFSAKLPPFGGLGDMTPPNASLPQGGTGWRLTNNIGALADAENFRAAKVGQAKALAEPFFDRLIELGALVQYPWTGATRAPDDFALVNAGTVKALFSFTVDEDADGLLDEWERRLFGSLAEDAGGDFDQDGITNGAERTAGTSPNDFYNGVAPQIVLVAGNNQTVLPNRVLPMQIKVRLLNANQQPLINSPVSFDSSMGTFSRGNGARWIGKLTGWTDGAGEMEVMFQASAVEGVQDILVRAGLQVLTVTATVDYDLPPLAPDLVRATPQGSDITLTWRDNSPDEHSFFIERSTNQRDWRIIAQVPEGATSYTQPVTPGVDYFYRVTSSYDDVPQ